MVKKNKTATKNLGKNSGKKNFEEENSRKNTGKKKNVTDKVYDSVFWTEACRLSRYLPMLVNEAFDEHFTMDAKVELISGKQTIQMGTGKYVRRFQDALFVISEALGQRIKKTYHFECEVKGSRKVAIRIAEYGSAHAFKSVREVDGGAEMEIPNSAVIFLRSNSENIDKVTNHIKYPGGRVSYDVPIIKIKDYSLAEIFEKKLLLLIPFYVFSITEKEYKEMEKDLTNMAKLKKLVKDIGNRLQDLVDKGLLESYQKANLMRYTYDVLSKILEKRSTVMEGVEEFMGGYIIETEFDRMKEKMDEMEASMDKMAASLAQKDDMIVQLRKELEKYKKNNGEVLA